MQLKALDKGSKCTWVQIFLAFNLCHGLHQEMELAKVSLRRQLSKLHDDEDYDMRLRES